MNIWLVVALLEVIVLLMAVTYLYTRPQKYEFKLFVGGARKYIVIRSSLKSLEFNFGGNDLSALEIFKDGNGIVGFKKDGDEKLVIKPISKTRMKADSSASSTLLKQFVLLPENGDETITLNIKEVDASHKFTVVLKHGR